MIIISKILELCVIISSLSKKSKILLQVSGWFSVNIVQIFCTYVCKWKNETCWNFSRDGGGEIKDNDGGDEFK
jgi:hypothetical protein